MKNKSKERKPKKKRIHYTNEPIRDMKKILGQI